MKEIEMHDNLHKQERLNELKRQQMEEKLARDDERRN
jgi:hypothetical protein